MIKNIGSVLVVIIIYTLAALIAAVLFKVKRVWNRLGSVIYWNGLIRLFLELYQDIALLSFLNLKSADWDTVYTSVSFSNYLSAIFITIIIAVPILLGIVLFRNRT